MRVGIFFFWRGSGAERKWGRVHGGLTMYIDLADVVEITVRDAYLGETLLVLIENNVHVEALLEEDEPSIGEGATLGVIDNDHELSEVMSKIR